MPLACEQVQNLPARGRNVSLGRWKSSGRLVFVTHCTSALAEAARPATGRHLRNISDILGIEASVGNASARLITPWISGLSLEEYVLLHGPTQARGAARTLEPIARGLDELHACGAVHGFVSSKSIFVNAQGQEAVLTHAAPTDDPRWHSPERLKDGRPSAADDVWAWHMVLLEVVSGENPFPPGAGNVDVLASIEQGALERAIATVDEPSIQSVLRAGLSRIEGRTSTARAAADALDRTPRAASPVLEQPGKVAAASHTSAVSSATTRPRGRRLRGLLAGSAMGIAVLAGVIMTHQWLAGASPSQSRTAPQPPSIASNSVSPGVSKSPPPVASPASSVPNQTQSLDACVRRHFLPGAFAPGRSLQPLCAQADGRALVKYVTTSLVLASEGRLTEAMDEWSRLQGFQPVALSLVRARCCQEPAAWQGRTRSEQQLWRSVEELTVAVLHGKPGLDALSRYQQAAVRAGPAWWYAGPPCSGGQEGFDRFATRNGWSAPTEELCMARIGR